MHPQYCRSPEPQASHDILIQENHGNVAAAAGSITQADRRRRGRHPRHSRRRQRSSAICPGAATATSSARGTSAGGAAAPGPSPAPAAQPAEAQLIEGLTRPARGPPRASSTPGRRAQRPEPAFPTPHFYHFATDIAGEPTDLRRRTARPEGQPLPGMNSATPGKAPAHESAYAALPQSDLPQGGAHPSLPFARRPSWRFFNSDESGSLQAYMIRGLEHG